MCDPMHAPCRAAADVETVVRHAQALADRLQALPEPPDPAVRRGRQERTRALRWAAVAGDASRGEADESQRTEGADAG